MAYDYSTVTVFSQRITASGCPWTANVSYPAVAVVYSTVDALIDTASAAVIKYTVLLCMRQVADIPL